MKLMKLKIMGFHISCALFAFSLCGSDVDSSQEEENQERTIAAGASDKFSVGDVEGYQIIGLGSFNIKIPYKKLSTMIVKNLSAHAIRISVNVDRNEQLISVRNIASPSGTLQTKVPKIIPGLTLQNTTCGVGYGATADITFE
jgi:hypothetical protein